MMLRNKKILLILLALMVVLMATGCGASKAEKLNNEGNDAFMKQAYQEALVDYQTAQIEEPELAEPYYNAANALYRQGAYANALEQMEMALSYAEQEALAQAGFYNLGNSFYNQQDLQTAVASYTDALLINPDDQDAKYNLELALQQLQQQQNEEEQQEEEQESESEEDQESEESEDGESQEEEQQDQGEEEQEQPEEGQEEEEQESESAEGQEEEEQESESEEGQEEEEQQGQGQPQEGQPEEEQEGQLNELPQPGQRMTEEQAEQLLAAIARDGQTLQEKLGQIFSVPWTPPVQDW